MEMKKRLVPTVDINEPATWIPFKKHLCENCRAGCCTLPVEVRTNDLVRMEIIDPFEADDPPKKIARRLIKAGIIDHFNFKSTIYSLARKANDDCIYIESTTRRCTIYDKRPDTCRNHPAIGPRAGFCAYQQQDSLK